MLLRAFSRTQSNLNGDFYMELDRKALDRLLCLNDAQLKAVIRRVASDSGVNLADFNIDCKDIASVRKTLASASDEDIQSIASQLGKKRP